MKLISFQVEKFRNIVNSTLVTVQDDVTCLVGKNESGKTAALNALYRLNPAYPESFKIGDHYPRWLKTQDERSGIIKDAKTIIGHFELDEADIAAVEVVFGTGILADKAFSYTRGYENNSADLNINYMVGVHHFLANSATQQTTKDLFASYGHVDELTTAIPEKLAAAQDVEDSAALVADLETMQTELTAHIGTDRIFWQAVVALIRDRMPKFFYFSSYQLMPGRIDLSEIDDSSDGPGATPAQTARALLKLAQTTVETLSDDDYEDRTAALEAVSNDLTDQVFEYWSQNEKLEVSIDVDPVIEEDGTGRGYTKVAHFLDIRVRDRRHNYTDNFSKRSAGFQWFFSFLAAFSEFEGKDDKVVVLLDEPGLALHAKAQADFLRFIDERLAPNAQVIYTTHSPFMVETGKLERVRVVEDKGTKKGTEISSEVLSVHSDTLFPLQAALGYDIAQSLFIGPNNLLVEGTSDFTYLTAIGDYLESLGRKNLDEKWRILPTGSVANVPSFVALMGRKLDVTVFVDLGPGMQRLQNLTAQGLLKANRLLTVGDITGTKNADIEDLFDPADYLKLLYNPTFGTALTVSKLKPGVRLIDRISRTQGTDFIKHGKPADYLLRNRDKILDKLSSITLDNFETAIKKINATKGK